MPPSNAHLFQPAYFVAHRRIFGLALVALTMGLALLLYRPPTDSLTWTTPVESRGYGSLPLHFEPNVGQTDASVRYMAHASGGTLFFAPDGVALALRPSTGAKEASDGGPDMPGPGGVPLAPKQVSMRMRFVGANPATSIATAGSLPGKVSYLLGSDPSKWHTDLPTYAGIAYASLYPGVDLAYTGSDGLLKGTYTVAPGADPGAIRWRYAGVDEVAVDARGNLQIRVQDSPVAVTEQAPVAWQDIDGNRAPVSASYKVASDGSVGFTLGAYNRAYPLVIDPTLTYSTYLGGSANDYAYAVVLDPAGDIYVAGYTASTNFPTANAFQGANAGANDAFITKLSADGATLLYSTYLGGTGDDYGRGLTLDGMGNAYLTGATSSTNFPVQNAFQPTNSGGLKAFLTKLAPSGSSLVYSTYLGGSGGFDYGWGVAVDTGGSAYVSGFTNSTNFPTRNPYQPAYGGGLFDAFMTRFTPVGNDLVYSTYLGGVERDYSRGLAVDSSGNAYVTGQTYSANYPSTAGAFQLACASSCTYGDAFVTKLNSTGTALIYSTFLGGNIEEVAYGIALDSANAAYLTGTTTSLNFPTRNPFQPNFVNYIDAFVTKLNAAGSDLVYSTYLGGNSTDYGYAITVDAAQSAYVTGYANSTNFPIQNPIQPSNAGGQDVFVTKFQPPGQTLEYSTYLGGSAGDVGYGITNRGGVAYVTGHTDSTDFPTQNPRQPANAGANDAFIVKISDTAGGTPTSTSTAVVPTATTTRTATTILPTLTPTSTSIPATGTATVVSPSATSSSTSIPSATQPPATSTVTSEPTACTITFSDVPENHTFYPWIRCLACRGIISGYSDGTFKPGNDITRGQIAKIVSNSAGFSEDPGPQLYEDVPPASPFYAWVNRLSLRGHMGGYPCGLAPDEPCVLPANRPYFRPNQSATRGQLSKIVSNAAGLNSNPSGQFYTDVAEGHPFYVWIMRLTELGVMSGYECGGAGEECDPQNRPYFRPFNNVTRGQASKIVANTFFPNCQIPSRR